MSRFFVGQRVRILYLDLGSVERGLRLGVEGVIAFPGVHVDWNVDFPGFRNNRRGGGSVFPMYSNEIEPITDQHQSCGKSFEELMAGLREGVTT